MDEIRARIISQEKGIYKISDGVTEKLASVSGKFRFGAKTVSDYPAVGDYVIAKWPKDDGNAIIESLFPRKSVFIRKAAGPGKQEQIVAANIDTIFICMSLNNNYNIRRLERYLSIAYDSGADSVIVLTKADLCENINEKISEVESVANGISVIAISSVNNDYDKVLEYIISGKTVAFLGSSGVGKSTLINKLSGKELLATGEIGNDDKGKHTTTHRELIALENGAFVIDTPGMRELGMWDNADGIEKTFADIDILSKKCKFSDCSHISEPGCAIQNAIADGTLDKDRWEAYLKLKIENAVAADGSQYLISKRAKFKEIAKKNKASKKNHFGK